MTEAIEHMTDEQQKRIAEDSKEVTKMLLEGQKIEFKN